MAAPLVQRVELDAASAQRQLALLERQLATLNNPINVPVDIDVDGTQRAERQMEGLRQEVDRTGDEFTELGRKADQSTDGILRVGTRGASAFTSLRGSIIGVGAAIAAIQGVRILGGFAADAIQQASSLQEALSKTNVVFDEFSDDIQKFAKTAPQALGLSQSAALQAVSTFGNLFVALGLTQEAAADLSPDIVQLAADLASFNDIGVQEAVEKLRSGLVGEVEPLRSLGVNLTAALVEAKALELGLVDASGAVTEAGKVQARYALILEQTATAQGDYARTADGIANTQRTVTALFEDAQTAVGEALLPAYKALLEIAPAVIAAIEGLAPVIRDLSTSFADGAPTAQQFVDVLQTISEVPTVFGTIAGGLKGISDVLVGSVQSLTDYEAGNARANAGLKQFSDTVDNFNVQALRNGIINAMQAGRDPILALADALVELNSIGLDPSALLAEAEALTAIAGVDMGQASQVAATLKQFGANAGLSVPDVQKLTTAVLGFFTRTREGAVRFSETRLTGEQLTDVARDVEAAVLTESQALEILGRAADDADTSISALLANQANLDPALQAAASGLSTSTLKYLEQVEAINEVKGAIGALPGAMDAAQAALKDSEGEIIEDFSQFFANLQEELSKREAFESNLAILRALGLDNLAQVFDEAGLDAAGALADAVSDPNEARNAEAALRGNANDQAAVYMETFKEAIAGIPVTQGLIDNIISAAAGADSPEVQQALIALAEALELQIPVTFDLTGLGNFTIPQDILDKIKPDRTPTGQRTGGDIGRGGEVNIFQEFHTEPAPSTTTQRAAMEIAAVVAGTRGL